MKRTLNLISFNVPYPPNYGGVIDVFYKIKSLKELGVNIILHTFYNLRKPSPQLEEIASEVYYYPQKGPLESLSLQWPLMVKSRSGQNLLQNLQKNDAPILFEGIQSSFYLPSKALKDRKKIVRIHNVEWQYYRALKNAAKSWNRRMQFSWESRLLLLSEKIFSKADLLLPISRSETRYYEEKFDNVAYLPAFHQNERITSQTGQGKYLLYHGNLSVPENEKAALFLIERVSPFLDEELMIAGQRPSPVLRQICKLHKNVVLVADPPETGMQQLMTNAHIHLMHTFQATGIKLKLINALFQGRFILGNDSMLADTGLEEIAHRANEPGEYVNKIKELKTRSFETEDLDKRKAILHDQFDNRRNAEKLVEWIFNSGQTPPGGQIA